MGETKFSKLSAYEKSKLASLSFNWLIRERWQDYNHLIAEVNPETNTVTILDTKSGAFTDINSQTGLDNKFYKEMLLLLKTIDSIYHHCERSYDRIVSHATEHFFFRDEDGEDIFSPDYEVLKFLFLSNLEAEKTKDEIEKKLKEIKRQKQAKAIYAMPKPGRYVWLIVKDLEATGLDEGEMFAETMRLRVWLDENEKSSDWIDDKTMDSLLNCIEAIKESKEKNI